MSVKTSTVTINNWEKLPVLLDLHTAALVFNVSDGTLKKWLYSGQIQGKKIGRKWFFPRDYIRSLCEL